MLFADDKGYLCTYEKKSEKVTEQKIQNYLIELEKWVNKWRLKLAPHQYNQTVFSRYKRGGKNRSMLLKIYGENIESDEIPNFLVIKFDKFLNFKNQISEIKSKVSDRVNQLKILSYDKKMRLKEEIIIKIYKCLVGSIDYSCIFINSLWRENLQELEIIQNNRLRIVFKIAVTRR